MFIYPFNVSFHTPTKKKKLPKNWRVSVDAHLRIQQYFMLCNIKNFIKRFYQKQNKNNPSIEKELQNKIINEIVNYMEEELSDFREHSLLGPFTMSKEVISEYIKLKYPENGFENNKKELKRLFGIE